MLEGSRKTRGAWDIERGESSEGGTAWKDGGGRERERERERAKGLVFLSGRRSVKGIYRWHVTSHVPLTPNGLISSVQVSCVTDKNDLRPKSLSLSLFFLTTNVCNRFTRDPLLSWLVTIARNFGQSGNMKFWNALKHCGFIDGHLLTYLLNFISVDSTRGWNEFPESCDQRRFMYIYFWKYKWSFNFLTKHVDKSLLRFLVVSKWSSEL